MLNLYWIYGKWKQFKITIRSYTIIIILLIELKNYNILVSLSPRLSSATKETKSSVSKNQKNNMQFC